MIQTAASVLVVCALSQVAHAQQAPATRPAPNWGAAPGMAPAPAAAPPGAPAASQPSPAPDPSPTRSPTAGTAPMPSAQKKIELALVDVFIERSQQGESESGRGPWASTRLGPGGTVAFTLKLREVRGNQVTPQGAAGPLGLFVRSCADPVPVQMRMRVANRSTVPTPRGATALVGASVGQQTLTNNAYVVPATGAQGETVLTGFALSPGTHTLAATLWPISSQQVDPQKNQVKASVTVVCEGLTSAPTPGALR
ncbi:MAG: hypothetical protein U5L03_01305 [Burkholderiaceae bacterium]|nr:hypothetical protein [Burkholderiaceae bacterium]